MIQQQAPPVQENSMSAPRQTTLARLTADEFAPKSPGKRLRRYFLVGLVIMAPVGLTILFLRWLFLKIDSILGVPIRHLLGVSIPGLGLVLLVLIVLITGWAVHLAVGRQLLRWWNSALLKFPFGGRIYSAISQVIQAVIGSRHTLFIRAVLVPYPTKHSWVVALVTREDPPEMAALLGEPCVNVFVPTTPNPTTGFMLVVPLSQTKPLDTTVEEAMKLIVSAGAVRARLSRAGLDIDTLLMNTREWQQEQG
jgi:uncharacterized membrane protein